MKTQTTTPSAASLELVRWAAGLGVITAEALARHAGLTPASARGRLQAAVRAGLMQGRRPLTEAPPLYTLTRAGARASGLAGIEPVRVSAANAAHAAVCAAVAAALGRAYPDHTVMGERELRRQERAAGTPLASATIGCGPGGAPLLHRPDLVLWPGAAPAGPPVAIEVELTIKAPQRLFEICRGWARCGLIAGCVYLTESPVEAPLARAIGQAQAGERVALVPLAALLGGGTGIARGTASTVPVHA